MIGVV